MQYRKRLERLIEIVRRRREGGLPRELAEEVERDQAEYLAALAESTHFGDVMQHLQDLGPTVLRPKVHEVLKGPILPRDEDPESTRARNTLFELNLAGHLKRAGLIPQLGEHPDVKTLVGDEVSRPALDVVSLKKALIEAVVETGSLTAAAKKLGQPPWRTAYDWRGNDEAFSAALDLATRCHGELIEGAGRRRDQEQVGIGDGRKLSSERPGLG